MKNPYKKRKLRRMKKKSYYCSRCGRKQEYYYESQKTKLKLCAKCLYYLKWKEEYKLGGDDEKIMKYKYCNQCGKELTNEEKEAGCFLCWDCWQEWVRENRKKKLYQHRKEISLFKIKRLAEIIDIDKAGINWTPKPKHNWAWRAER